MKNGQTQFAVNQRKLAICFEGVNFNIVYKQVNNNNNNYYYYYCSLLICLLLWNGIPVSWETLRFSEISMFGSLFGEASQKNLYFIYTVFITSLLQNVIIY
jgi:hypothetical protein